MEQLGSHWKDFHEILYLSIFRKTVEKIKVSLQSEENLLHMKYNMYFYHISLIISSNGNYFTTKL